MSCASRCWRVFSIGIMKPGLRQLQVKIKVSCHGGGRTRPDGTSGPTYYLDPTFVNGQFPATLTAMNFRGITADAQEHLRGELPFHEGDVMQYEDLRQMDKAAAEFRCSSQDDNSRGRATIEFALLFALPEARAIRLRRPLSSASARSPAHPRGWQRSAFQSGEQGHAEISTRGQTTTHHRQGEL